MNKYYQLILDNKMESIVIDVKIRELMLDYNRCDPEEAFIEMQKLIFTFWRTTYLSNENVRLYWINDEPLYYSSKMLEYVRDLLDFAHEHNCKDESEIISYFVTSLYHSYKNGQLYIQNISNNDNLKTFHSCFESKLFHEESLIVSHSISFAINLLDIASKSKENFISFGDIVIECCSICYRYRLVGLEGIIKSLISLATHNNSMLIKYDEEVDKNSSIYLAIELNNLSQGTLNDLTVIRELYNRKLIVAENETDILDIFSKRFKAYQRSNDDLLKLNNLASLEKEVFAFRNMPNTSTLQKESLKSLVLMIQKSIRLMLQDGKPELKQIEGSIDLPPEFQKYKEQTFIDYDTNIITTIFRQCLVHFETLFEESIRRMVDSILSVILTRTIENPQEGLYTGDDVMPSKSSFNEYFSELLVNYFENNQDKYTNHHFFKRDNAYIELMNYAKFSIPIQTSLCAGMLKEKYPDINIESVIYCKLYGKVDYIDNYYVMLMNMIIHTEFHITQIYNHLESKSENAFKEEYLEYVFEKLHNNELVSNGIMYINFVLYDNLGFRLRDKVSHGNFESGFAQLDTFLMILTSLLASSAVLNEVRGESNGK